MLDCLLFAFRSVLTGWLVYVHHGLVGFTR